MLENRLTTDSNIIKNIFAIKITASFILAFLVCLASFSGNITIGALSLCLSFIGIVDPLAVAPTVFIVTLSSDYYSVAGISFTKVLLPILLVGMLFRCLREKRTSKSTIKWDRIKWDIAILLLFICYLISFINASIQNNDMLSRILMMILLFYLSSKIRVNMNELQKLVEQMIVASVTAFAFLVLSSLLDPTYIGGRLSIADISPNRFTIIVVQLCSILLCCGVLNLKSLKYIYILILPLSAYMILMSGSRTGMISLGAAVLLSMIYYNIDNNNIFKILRNMLVILILITIVILIIGNSQELSDRFDINEVIEEGGTGRLDRIAVALRYIIPENLWVGVGPFENEQSALFPFFPVEGAASAHNIVISMLINLGIFGLIVYVYLYSNIFSKLLKGLKENKLFLLPLLLLSVAICNGIGEVIYYEKFFWIIISISLIFINRREVIE